MKIIKKKINIILIKIFQLNLKIYIKYRKNLKNKKRLKN